MYDAKNLQISGVFIVLLLAAYLVFKRIKTVFINRKKAKNAKMEFVHEALENKFTDCKFNALVVLAIQHDTVFFKSFKSIFPEFIHKLYLFCPTLSENDIHLCAYLKLNFSTKEIAACSGFSIRSIESRKYRLRKKLAIPQHENLYIWMMKLEKRC